jgi:phosphomannomutase/phosphomannomutase/phosphoglucomutase
MTIFKAYDVRAIVPDQLNEKVAYRIGLAFLSGMQGKKVCVGRDIRLSSEMLQAALIKGLCEGGADVFNLGLCGTEEVYYQTFSNAFDGGIMVTASHNPMNYNGMKFVREGARPISGDTGLFAIRDRVAKNEFIQSGRTGREKSFEDKDGYIDHLLGYVEGNKLAPFKILATPGNGCAGPVVRKIADKLPSCSFEFIQEEPDGSFPNGIPNPLLPDRRAATSKAVLKAGADVGIAWDGDFDRCFFYDEKGQFIEGYYIVGLLAQSLLGSHPGAKIIHDPRLTWNTIATVEAHGGSPVESKTGHSFIKEKMRSEDAVYGGEMSAHHYFKEFGYCDSGMIPWLLVLDVMTRTGLPLSELVAQMQVSYPISGEINRVLSDPLEAIQVVENKFSKDAVSVGRIDGLSMDMGEWRFNLRSSNTESVVRLNVESRGDKPLMDEKTRHILDILEPFTKS